MAESPVHAGSGTLALLIDAENASPKIVAGLLAEVAGCGTAIVRRVYGDWTGPSLKGWKACLLERSLQPVQQFAYAAGKNATDGAMIIDAMDLLHTGRFSGFCIVSSDGDFARLAARIREQGVAVYGFGERKTPRHFVAACDRFVYLDALGGPAPKTAPQIPKAGKAEAAKPVPKPPARSVQLDAPTLSALKMAVAESAGGDGRASLARVGAALAKRSPGFASRNHGFARLGDLMEATGMFLVERGGEGSKVATVRLRPDPSF